MVAEPENFYRGIRVDRDDKDDKDDKDIRENECVGYLGSPLLLILLLCSTPDRSYGSYRKFFPNGPNDPIYKKADC